MDFGSTRAGQSVVTNRTEALLLQVSSVLVSRCSVRRRPARMRVLCRQLWSCLQSCLPRCPEARQLRAYGTTAISAAQRNVQEDAERTCTAPYRAPELFDVASQCTVDEKIDCWSLGEVPCFMQPSLRLIW